MKNRRSTALALLALAALLLSGCTFVRLQNVSDSPVRVLVRVPDSGSAYTRQVRAGELVDVFSAHGGAYSATLVPDPAYRDLLLSLQTQIGDRLFNERATLTAQEVAELVQRLNQISVLLDELAQPGASCSGSVPDYETAVVVIFYDSQANVWSLTCG